MAGVKEIAKLTGLTQEQIHDVFDSIQNLAFSGVRVIIRRFGSFRAVERKRRTIRSPAIKGGSADVKPSMVIRYKPSKEVCREMKARVSAKPRKK